MTRAVREAPSGSPRPWAGRAERYPQVTPLAAVAMAALGAYKRFISPLLPAACRFQPTCSEYGYEALRRHGLIRGSLLTVKRLLRCHPFHPGGFDPP